MRSVQSCGVLVVRLRPEPAFLLLKHGPCWDLPKGQRAEGETEIEYALRELVEETGLKPAEMQLVEGFRHESVYHPIYRRFNNERVEKTVTLFLAWLPDDRPLALTEHDGFEWLPWPPDRSFENSTIDGVLAAARPLIERQLAGVT
jgi:8-oxo-dGTP pyrophosphatase MutT (NUDIX family)